MTMWLRDGVQQFKRDVGARPGWLASVLGLLALALGINIATFAVVDAALFRSLEVAEPDALVRVFGAGREAGQRNTSSYPFLADLARDARTVAGYAPYSSGNSVHARVGNAYAERRSAALVAGNYFDLLGLEPGRGRLLQASDETGDGAVAVVSERYLRDALGGSDAAIGSQVLVNGQPVTIVGVLPRGFHGMDLEAEADLWLPLAANRFVLTGMGKDRALTQRGFWWLECVMRLAPGATLAQAAAELEARAQTLRASQPLDEQDPLPVLLPARDAAVDAYGTEQTRRIATTLALGVALILLVTCANVAGLVLVRLEDRRHELAVRLGLGASARALRGELLGGLVLTGLVGAVLGLLVADLLLRLLAAWDLASFVVPARLIEDVYTVRVGAAALAFSAVAVVASAWVPLRRTGRVDAGTELKGQGTQTLGAERDRVRIGLVVLQSALAVVLMVGGGALYASFRHLASVDPGFRIEGMAVARVDVAMQGYEPPRRAAFRAELLERLAARGDLDAVALANIVPVNSNSMSRSYALTPPKDRTETTEHAYFNAVSAGYFQTLSIPLLAGRVFNASDEVEGAPPRIVVNAALAERHFRGRSAVGGNLYTTRGPLEIIGVVANTKLVSLDEVDAPMFYTPIAASDFGFYTVVAYARGGQARVALDAIQETVRALDPGLPMYGTRTLAEQLSGVLATPRLLALAATALASVAMVLCLSGLYALISHTVRARRREIGLRMALGADRVQVYALFLRRGYAWAGIGAAIGALASMSLGHQLDGLLFATSGANPRTLLLALACLLAGASLAIWWPTRGALRADPIASLRND